MKSTAMHRNFIRTPRIISIAAGIMIWLVFTYLSMPYSFAVGFASGFIGGYLGFNVYVYLSANLIRTRFGKWARDYHGINKDEVHDWIEGIDPVQLDEMIAVDLEGATKEE